MGIKYNKTNKQNKEYKQKNTQKKERGIESVDVEVR